MKNKIGVAAAIYDSFGIEKAFKSTSENGFKFIELVYAKGFVEKLIKKPEEMNKKDLNIILNLSKKYSVNVYAVSVCFYFGDKNAVNRLKKVIDVAKLLGANTIVTDTGEIKEDEDDKKKVFYKDIKEIANYAMLNDITVCFEIHGGWCSNGKQGAEIIKTINHPNIRLNYDTANVIFYGGGRPEEDIVNALPYMAFMHLKDKSGKDNEWNFPALGEGNINFKKIFNLIKDYDGPISIEVELTQEEHSLKEINDAYKKSYNFLKRYGYIE